MQTFGSCTGRAGGGPPCDRCGRLGRYRVSKFTSSTIRCVGCAGPQVPGTCRQLVLLGTCSGYEAGERVQLAATSDRFADLRPGTQGEVGSIDDLGTVHVLWDTGSTLGMVPGADRIRRVSLREVCGRCSKPFSEGAWRRRHLDVDGSLHAECCRWCVACG